MSASTTNMNRSYAGFELSLAGMMGYLILVPMMLIASVNSTLMSVTTAKILIITLSIMGVLALGLSVTGLVYSVYGFLKIKEHRTYALIGLGVSVLNFILLLFAAGVVRYVLMS